ncbi:hypothetical protein E4T56_gene4569, partial [Termitomyces sp. T112]
ARFLILDAEAGSGGAWRHGWQSLHLFSPAGYSSLPGWLMPPPAHEGYPTRDDVLDYLARYEERYQLPIKRPIRVESLRRADDGLTVVTDQGNLAARFIVHSAHYVRPEDFAGQSVLVVGGGNSGAQIMAELSQAAHARRVTTDDPLFLPDDVDGRVLFERAVARMKAGPGDVPVGGIGDIVMVPPIKAARERGDLTPVRPFERMTKTGVCWADGTEEAIDAVIWCTGFRPALDHLCELNVIEQDGRVLLDNQRSIKEPSLWLAGYGDWTGAGSATLMGAARTARDLAALLVKKLNVEQ